MIPILWRVASWFGWKAGGFALLALCALAWGGVHSLRAANLKRALALSRADLSVLEAQRDAASELARDYEARAAQAVADKILADQAAAKAADARKRKWQGIRQSERAWSETPVPKSVVEALR